MRQFHLRISDSLADQLEEMKKLTDASSVSSVLRDAVCLYTWFLTHTSEGHEIIAISGEGEKPKESMISTPGLEVARMKTAVKA